MARESQAPKSLTQLARAAFLQEIADALETRVDRLPIKVRQAAERFGVQCFELAEQETHERKTLPTIAEIRRRKYEALETKRITPLYPPEWRNKLNPKKKDTR